MSPEKQRYALETLPTHLGDAREFQRLHRLLTNFDFIEAKLDALGVQALIQDYEFVGNITPCPFQEKPGDELPAPAKTLTLIEDGIRLSAHILAADKNQLAAQLWGRLMAFELPGIQALLAQAKPQNSPWLRPLTSSLMPPGTPLRRTLTGHTSWVQAVAITPDGKQAVSASHDETLKVWDLQSGKELKTLTGHTHSVEAVAITPDRKRAVSASWDTSLIVWNLQSGIPRKMLLAHTDSVESVAITPNGQWAVSTSRDKFLILWDLHRDEIITTFKGDGELLCCAVAPDGLTIVAGEASGRVHFLRLENSSAFGSECNG